jgi:sporulation protein YlmC with PRC-barrel domain
MDKTSRPAEPATLCYLDNSQIEGPLEEFEGVEVRNRGDRKIGRLDGIVIDPTEGLVRYLVVNDGGLIWNRKYLLPLDGTRVDAEHRALCVEVDRADLAGCEKFNSDSFRAFSFRAR